MLNFHFSSTKIFIIVFLGSNPQNEVAFGVYGAPGDFKKDSPVDRKRIIRKVIQDGSPSTPMKVSVAPNPRETDIITVKCCLIALLIS